ncbi:MAG: flavodoxin family protein [Candidatus Methylomirabilales bacterium]
MRVVAFNGSPRAFGNTAALLKTALEELEREGIHTEVVHIPGPLHGCQGCRLCAERKDGRCAAEGDELNRYLDLMVQADGILLGSPTYFADVTANMKALIERSGMVARVNGDLLRRKVGAGVVAVRRAGAMHAFDSLLHFFTISQMIVVGSSYWNIGIGREPGAVLRDEEGLDTLRTLGRNMAWLLQKINRT